MPEHTPLSRKQVAERLGVAPKTVSRLVRDGELVAVRRTSGRLSFERSDVEAYVQGHKTATPIRIEEAGRPMSPGQGSAFHAKCADLGRLHGSTKTEVKVGILAEASQQFGREITSSTELLYHEATWALDALEERIDAARKNPMLALAE